MDTRVLGVLLCLIAIGCKATDGKEGKNPNGTGPASSALSASLLDVTTVDDVRAHEATRQIGLHCGLTLQLPTVSQTTEAFCTQAWGNAESSHEEYVQTMLTGLNHYCGVGPAATISATGTNALLLKGGAATPDVDQITAELEALLGIPPESATYTAPPGSPLGQPTNPSAPPQAELLRQMFCQSILPFLYPGQFAQPQPQPFSAGPTY